VRRRHLLAASFPALIAIAAFAQRGGFVQRSPADGAIPQRDAEFHFLRMEYTDMPEYHRGYGFSGRYAMGNGWWMMDWPDAERHFTRGVQRLTRIDSGDPRHMRITDDRVFEYPWIYATQTGWWDLSDAETLRLREYLLRGGFLVVDDFYGAEQWDVFQRTMERVFPGRPIVEIGLSDPVLHVLYDIGEKDLTFIPGSRHLRQGPGGNIYIQQPPEQPAWRAIYDDKNRMVVAINFNSDVADAWEFADAPYYPEKMTSLAYRYGINYVIYSMTH
jgi:hypothetical protein